MFNLRRKQIGAYPGQGLLSNRSGCSKDILLVFPDVARHRRILYPPVNLLALSVTLTGAGFSVHILDDRLEPSDWCDQSGRAWGIGKCSEWWAMNADRLLFVGICAHAPRQTELGKRFAREIRLSHPDVPIVWGGWLPTRDPVSFVESPEVDLAVLGDADFSIVELAQAFYSGKDPRNVAGIAWLGNGARCVVNAPNRPIDASETPPMPFNTVPVSAYLRKNGHFLYISTRMGHASSKPKGDSVSPLDSMNSHYPPSRIVDDLIQLEREHHPAELRIVDEALFSDMDRTREILQGLLRRGFRTRWTAYTDTERLEALPGETIRLMADSECSRVFIEFGDGVRSGSGGPNTLIRLERMRRLVARLADAGINVTIAISSDSAGKRMSDFLATLDFVDWLHRKYTGSRFVFRYQTGTGEPSGLSELTKSDRRLHRIIHACFTHYLDLAYMTKRRFSDSFLTYPETLFLSIVSPISRFRVRRKFFRMAVGWRLVLILRKLAEYRDRIESILFETSWRYRASRQTAGFTRELQSAQRNILETLMAGQVKTTHDSKMNPGENKRSEKPGSSFQVRL